MNLSDWLVRVIFIDSRNCIAICIPFVKLVVLVACLLRSNYSPSAKILSIEIKAVLARLWEGT